MLRFWNTSKGGGEVWTLLAARHPCFILEKIPLAKQFFRYILLQMDTAARLEELELEVSRLRKLGRTKRQPVKGIGGVIQKAREEQGVGLRDLADRSKISAGLLSRIETTPDANPQFHTLRALAKGLRIKLSELVA